MNIEDLFDEKQQSNAGTSFGGGSLLDDLNELDEMISTMDFSKTAYVVSEKKDFRSESLNTALAKEYSTKLICTTLDGFVDISDPLFFVMDITGVTADKMFRKTVKYVQENARKANVPLFLIGGAEDLSSTNQIFDDNEIDIVRFERPIELNETIEEMTGYLMNFSVRDKKKRILVVDDSSVFLTMARKILGKRFKVSTADSAYKAIVEISKLRDDSDFSNGFSGFSLILVDYLMPICSGLVLAAMIRSEQPDAVICFYTSNECTDDIIKTMPFVDSYVLKSTPLDKVADTLEDLINKKEKERKYRKSNSKG